jgi:XTP/dITP diphosphohydrolase
VTTLLVATTNAGKLAEIRALLGGLPLTLASLAEFTAIPEPDEPGPTFAANACHKARYYARASGLLTVAEDSGLEIAALDSAPGVQSARFPGDSYEEKFARLYAMLDARGSRTSPARFVCRVALAQGDTVVFEAEGTIDGTIAPAPRGAGGFGYDPIFLYPPWNRTLAEVSAADKAEVSHRGRAFRALRRFLEQRELAF